MKTLFIKAKSNKKLDKSKILGILEELPSNIIIAYSIQFEDLALEIKKILKEKHNILSFVQVLGCTRLDFPKETQAILLISSGKFHAISLSYETKLPVFILENEKLTKISKKDLEIIEKKEKASYLKYLNSNNIGILVSTKPGQNRLKKARELKRKIKDKKSYLFLANNINTSEFENFGLDSWVNTACPRMDMNQSNIINISKL
jgi:diphthamide biosynthesis enzyme Dph1/Dph2-like protein